jgi:hypothetical protein
VDPVVGRNRRRGRLLWLVPAVALLAVLAVVVALRPHSVARPDGCQVTDGSHVTSLDLAQAANAATIAAVAARLGLGDHAVTIALATAFQESKLHNVRYGDRDSVGLFQQRPSQGWGSPPQLIDPHYSATAFFEHLAKVNGWQTMAVADAAQAVQRSAAPGAYADWEGVARVVAKALTGEVAKGIACTYASPASTPAGLPTALQRDVGSLTGDMTPKRGWRAASWLVAQAAQYSIDSVTFNGLRWSRATGRWSPSRSAIGVTYTLVR